MHFEMRIPLFLQLGFREAAIPSLHKYIELLWATNEELNLISRKMTFEDLIDNHVIDCMLPLQHFPSEVKSAADFGSGGGLPGIIFALQFPAVQFRLYEKSNLKRDFLLRCKALAPNIEVQADLPIKLLGVDLVTARAFKPIDVILDVSREYYKQKGHYFLLKGRAEKVSEEMALARKKFKDLQAEVIQLKSPLLEVERNLVLIGN